MTGQRYVAVRPLFVMAWRSHSRHTTLVSILLTGDRPVAENFPCQHTTPTWERHPCPDEIRTCSPRNRAAANPRLRPLGHWNRLIVLWIPAYFEHVTLEGPCIVSELLISRLVNFPCLWVPVTTAWRVLSLRMEERPPIWRVAANKLNKQSRTADKGWSSSLGVGRGANNSSPWKKYC